VTRSALFSGWNLEQRDANAETRGIDFTLVKPCRIEELLDAVQEIARFGDDC